MQGPNIVYDRGVHIEGTVLWFDTARPKDFCAISSARVPVNTRQAKLLLSDRTMRILSRRHGRRMQGLVSPFNRSFSLGNLRLEMFPSGYVAGAAQFEITLADGHRLVRTGPFSLQANRTAERIAIRKCDTLILDATYGHPRFAFPARESVYPEVVEFAADALASGATPVFLSACPGKAQDLIHLLGSEGFKIRVHRAIYAYNLGYLDVGVDLPLCRQFRGSPRHDEVVIWPAHLRGSKAIRNLKRARFAAMTGLGGEPGILRRLKVDQVMTWSARADYADTLAYVERARPKQVVTYGRYARELAAELDARRNLTATAIRQVEQLGLL